MNVQESLTEQGRRAEIPPNHRESDMCLTEWALRALDPTNLRPFTYRPSGFLDPGMKKAMRSSCGVFSLEEIWLWMSGLLLGVGALAPSLDGF